MARGFGQEARTAVSPREAVTFADTQTLPVPVPVTRGDMSRTASDQMTESQMLKGTYGAPAQTIMRGQRAEQQDALRANIPAIQQRLVGIDPAATVIQPGQSGPMVQNRLTGMKDAAKAGVDAAYDAARDTKGGVGAIHVQSLRQFIPLDKEVGDRLAAAPKAQARLDALDGLAAEAGEGEILVERLFDWRRATTKLASESNDATEKAAMQGMVRQFDKALPEMVRDGLFQGDQTAIKAWREAITARREFGKIFEGDDLIQQLTEKAPRSGTMQLKVSPEEATNYIFGRSDLGFTAKTNLPRDLVQLRNTLGQDSAEWSAIKQDAFLRFVRSAEGVYDMNVTERAFSGAKLASAVDGAMRQNPEIMRILFNQQELGLIQQFKRAALTVTTTTKGGENHSNTTAALGNAVQRLFGSALMGDKGRVAILAAMPWLSSPVYGIQAVGRTGATPTRRAVPPGLTGTIGAATFGP